MTKSDYLDKEKSYKLIEVTAPTGYQSGVNCSLSFDFSPYPDTYMKTHRAHPLPIIHGLNQIFITMITVNGAVLSSMEIMVILFMLSTAKN